jgi:uncharacterized protein YndB with AHSA1/START domain
MEFTLKTIINASPEAVYAAWLNSEGHTNMTGGEATISDQVGDEFTAWDGYIEGENLALEHNKRIVQSWRTAEFEETDEDSHLEILLTEIDGQTELTLIHTNLPEHGEQYIAGWENHYFQPMKDYFV